MSSWIAIVSALILLAACVNAAEVAVDSRFTKLVDKDNPAGFPADFKDRAAWEKRAESVRERTLVALGLWPMPERTPLEPVIWGPVERDGYTVEKVYFASLPGHYVTGNLYRPKGRTGKLPGVLCPYGHWPDGRFIWKNDTDIDKALADGGETTREAAKSPLQARCAMLARMGCVVFHYDLVGYCDSKCIEHRHGFTDAESILRLQSFMGLQAWNGSRALDFLSSLPEVDKDRIAVTGASGGGTQTFILGITDKERLAGTFPVVMVSMNMQGGCVCENAPLLRVGTNNVELASVFAPRPQGCAAANDWTSDFETRGLPEMKRIYGLFDAGQNIEGKHFPFGHNYNLHSREMMYGFMNRALKLDQPTPVKEKPFVPIDPKELSVFDKDHPQPADATDAAGVRKWMTQASDTQFRSLKSDPKAYEKMLRVALRAMVVDELPSAGEVEATSELPFGGGMWTGTIARKGTGERVPVKLVVPKDWSGEVTIVSDPTIGGGNEGARGKLTAAKHAVLDVGVFMTAGSKTGDFRPAKLLVGKPPSSANPPYAGFVLGYNRSIVANRVHDLLTAIAWVKGWEKTRSVHLLGVGEAGPSAFLAKALADEVVSRAVIDMNGFDFDKLEDDNDPMLLPGGLKFGGIYGFVPLAASGETLLAHATTTNRQTDSITIESDARPVDSLIEWLLR